MDISQQSLPGRTNSGFMYWPNGRIAWAASFGVAAVLGITLGLLPVGVMVGLIGFALISPAPNGRGYVYQWMAELSANRKLRRKEGVVHRQVLQDVLFQSDDGNQKKHSMAPVQVNSIPVAGGDRGLLTEVYTPLNDRQTMFTLADGWGEVVHADPEQMIVFNDSFAEALKEVANQSGPGLYASLFFARRPHDLNQSLAYFSRRRHTAEDPVAQRLAGNYSEALDLLYSNAGSVHSAIALQMPRPRAWNKLPLDQLPDEVIRKAPAFRLSEILRQQLHDIGIQGVRQPSLVQLHTLLRSAVDVVDISSFHADLFADREAEQAGDLKSPADSLALASGAFPDPDNWVAGKDYLRIGNSYHRYFYVPRFKNQLVPSGYFRQLYSLPDDIWYSIAFVYETQALDSEMRRRRFRRNDVQTERIRRASRGAIASPEAEQEEAKVLQAERELYFSGSTSIKSTLLASVSAGSLEGLDTAGTALENNFRAVRIPLRRIRGESLQVPVQMAMFGIRTDHVQ